MEKKKQKQKQKLSWKKVLSASGEKPNRNDNKEISDDNQVVRKRRLFFLWWRNIPYATALRALDLLNNWLFQRL